MRTQVAQLGAIHRLAECAGTAVCIFLSRYEVAEKTAVGVPSDLLGDVQELIKYVIVKQI